MKRLTRFFRRLRYGRVLADYFEIMEWKRNEERVNKK